MKKSDLIREIARRKNLSLRRSQMVIDHLFQAMTEALARGEKIEIRGLGTFKIKKKPPRVVKDPRTGTEIFVKERYVPVFKMGKSIKGALNPKKDK